MAGEQSKTRSEKCPWIDDPSPLAVYAARAVVGTGDMNKNKIKISVLLMLTFHFIMDVLSL